MCKNIILKSVLESVAQLVNVIHWGRKTFLILFSVMFLTDNLKIHVVVYMKKKPRNFIRALLKQHWDSPGKTAWFLCLSLTITGAQDTRRVLCGFACHISYRTSLSEVWD